MKMLPLSRRLSRYSLRTLVCFALLTVVACGDTDAVKKITAFSNATSLVTKNTDDAFDLIERKYEEAQIAVSVANYNSATFNPNAAVKVFFPQEDLKARKLVLEGLRQYAANLAQIMSNDQLNEFDTKTKALGTQLSTVNDDLVAKHILNHNVLNATEIRVFTTALNAIGRWFIEAKRRKIIKENVATMQDSIRAVCELMREDFGLPVDGEGTDSSPQAVRVRRPVRGLRAQLRNEYNDILRAENNFLIHNETKFSPPEKREEIKKLMEITNERNKADETIRSIQGGLKQLAATHDELTKAFDKKDLSLPQMISQLIAEGERIQSFYKDLEKK